MSEQEIFVGSPFSKMFMSPASRCVHQPRSQLLVNSKRDVPWHCDGCESDPHLYDIFDSIRGHKSHTEVTT
jgi:hypothetical protein